MEPAARLQLQLPDRWTWWQSMLAGRKDFPDMPEPEDTCELRKHTQRQGVMRLKTIAEVIARHEVVD